MTEKFTPGEWKACGNYIHIGDECNLGNILAMLCDGESCYHTYTEQRENISANARLIAAAPKMYSLLKLARHEFEAVAEWCDEHDLPDDARGYRNLANGILDVLMEIRGKE